MNQRSITFGRSTVGIQYESGPPAALVDFIFRHIPDSKADSPWTILRLDGIDDQGEIWLWQDERMLCKEVSYEGMANHLMNQVCTTLARESRGGLMLHSAAVQTSGLGVLLPGQTGAGKSTLTAWLVSSGFQYITDELVYIEAEGKKLTGFSRPISIKAPARHLLPDLLVGGESNGGIWRSQSADMIAPERFGAQVSHGESSIDLIVFPRFRPEQEVQMVRLSKAETAFKLMRCLANARNLTDHGLPEAIRLASAIPAYLLHYGETKQAGTLLANFVSGMI